MTVGEYFTYQSKGSQATLQCSYSSQRRGELDDNSDSQLVGWRRCIYRMHFWGTPAMHGSRIFPVNTFLQWSTHSMRWDVS